MARRPVIAAISEGVRGDRPPALVPRLWRRMTAAQPRDLAQLIARLLRSRLAGGQRPSEADNAEHAGGSGRPGDDGAPSETRLHLRAAGDAGCRSSSLHQKRSVEGRRTSQHTTHPKTRFKAMSAAVSTRGEAAMRIARRVARSNIHFGSSANAVNVAVQTAVKDVATSLLDHLIL